jgi:putative endonuclease
MLMVTPHLWAGHLSEQYARNWLGKQGLKLVIANYRCKLGELDLVMLHKGCLVVVEVRYRKSAAFGGGLESITRQKRLRISRATADFLKHHPQFRQHPLRFDALALTGPLNAPEVTWRQRAFDGEALRGYRQN